MHRRRNSKTTLVILGALAVLALGYFWYAQSRYQYFITTPVNP